MKFTIVLRSKILVYSNSTIIWNENSSHAIFILWVVRGVVCDNNAANVLVYKKLKEEYLDEWKAWASITRYSEWSFFMTLCTLSKTFRIIFRAIKGSCFRGSIFLDLSLVWLYLVVNYHGDYCMMFTKQMVDAVPTWGKRTNSMLRYKKSIHLN